MAKLVDILARELKAWPENCTCGYCCQSDETTDVYFGGPAGIIKLSERADETVDVIVTREEWQEAVNAIKARPAIKTLEERIKDRAAERFILHIAGLMRRTRDAAEASLNKPLQPGGSVTITQAIDELYAAIIREQAPVECDKALDKALAELVERIDYEPNMISPRG